MKLFYSLFLLFFLSVSAGSAEPSELTVTPLLSDPGSTEDSTILGIDSDSDGVRDDFQHNIANAIPDDPLKRAGAMFYAKVSQIQFKSYLENPDISFEQFGLEATFMWEAVLLLKKTGAKDAIPIEQLIAWKENTPERYVTNRKIDNIFNGHVLPHPDHYDYQELARKEFLAVYEREKERQNE